MPLSFPPPSVSRAGQGHGHWLPVRGSFVPSGQVRMMAGGLLAGYRVPRFTDVPELDVVLLDRPDLPSAGAGETPLIAAAPAVANAIFAATGRRLRSLPLIPEGAIRWRVRREFSPYPAYPDHPGPLMAGPSGATGRDLGPRSGPRFRPDHAPRPRRVPAPRPAAATALPHAPSVPRARPAPRIRGPTRGRNGNDGTSWLLRQHQCSIVVVKPGAGTTRGHGRDPGPFGAGFRP